VGTVCIRDFEDLLMDLLEGVDSFLEFNVVRRELCLSLYLSALTTWA
jgi:hypothetical protein